MKIKTDQVIKTIDGVTIQDADGSNLTFGKAIANMLLAPRRGESGAYEFDKMKTYILAHKFYTEKEVDIDDADLKKLKNVIETDTAYGPLVPGFILFTLNKKEEK